MKISPELFQAYLKCQTKCWLRATHEVESGNSYADWVKTQNEQYRATGTERLVAMSSSDDVAASPDEASMKTDRWRLATKLVAQAQIDSGVVESELHAVERVPSRGRGRAAQFIPIRFIFTNKLSKDDKLLVAFDSFVLSKSQGREIKSSKIIHGDDNTTLKVNASALAGGVRKHVNKIAELLSGPTPPDLVLNRHCAECEFQVRCRKNAIEKDDLSLLANMSAKERQKFRSKGIFTVTQLSYTFRPRRRPKKLRDRREKYHHALKALAIREQKIHIVGSPEFNIEGTPVYLDVEGMPDRDFYYLIGLRIGNGQSAIQHSLWADSDEDEGKIWRKFLGILETLKKPVLIHYGSYEAAFLKRMIDRHGKPIEASAAASAIANLVNVVSAIFARTYFPTFRNGLKDVASFLGFKWSDQDPSGINAILWRHLWETSSDQTSRERLINYNSEDCLALQIVAQALAHYGENDQLMESMRDGKDTVSVESLRALETMWPKFKSPIGELEEINKAARWDYQRDRVYVRSSSRIRRIAKKDRDTKLHARPIAKISTVPEPPCCPSCGRMKLARMGSAKRTLVDIKLGKGSLTRKHLELHYTVLWCSTCRLRLGVPTDFWPKSKYGRSLVAFLLYQIIELCIPMAVVARSLNRLLGFNLDQRIIHNLKRSAARHYENVRQLILEGLIHGNMLHVDETRVSVKGKTACIWVLTNLHDVAYFYSDAREGEFVQNLLKDFRGVLVSDFFTTYDSFSCPQQKCLIHLIRDLNTDLLNQPYDEELREIVKAFAELLKPMIETVDSRGLKKHFLRKHQNSVERFYRRLTKAEWKSETAIKWLQRFERNRNRLFTFLDYDGVPWNNNNAEHAIKAFARLRDVIQGTCTSSAVQEYLVLLSICQSCKYMGVDFLDFFRSGEKDIYAFAESRCRRQRRSIVSPPSMRR